MNRVHGDRRRHQARIVGVQLEPGGTRSSAPSGPDGKAVGRNGIVVWKADDVSVENLTACNFLGRHG